MGLDASVVAELLSGFNISQHGLQASGQAFVVAGTARVVMDLQISVGRIAGDRANVCEKHLRLASEVLLSSGKDIYGNDMRTKRMAWRFGPAIADDTTAARLAALLNYISVRLQLSELVGQEYIVCEMDVNGVVSFMDSRLKR